ncbi:MAG: hypothetical protein ABH864_04375 [archaeon]
MNRLLTAGLATLALGVGTVVGTGCSTDRYSMTQSPIFNNDPKPGKFGGGVRGKPAAAVMFSRGVGYFSMFPCNEAIDLDGDGEVRGEEFLGSKKRDFRASEKITVVVSAASASRRGTKGLSFDLVNPRGEVVATKYFEATPNDGMFQYVLEESDKMPGWYSVNIRKDGRALFGDEGFNRDVFHRVFRIIE